MKKKLLLSVGSLAVGAAVVAGATFADFSSSQTVSNNSFTAGTLTMALEPGSAGESLNWSTPANWAPGQSVSKTIKFKNTGNVDAHHIYFNFNGLTNGGGTNGAKLSDKIYVSNLKETFNGTQTADQTANVAAQVGDNVMPLTLTELAGSQYYTWDDQTDDGVVLAGGGPAAASDYALGFTLTFDSSAGNDYQGATSGFSFAANATQNSPTEGYVALHQ